MTDVNQGLQRRPLALVSRARLWQAVIAALTVFLAWEIFSRSFVAVLATGAPEQALALHSRDVAALTALADDRLDRVLTTLADNIKAASDGAKTTKADGTADGQAAPAPQPPQPPAPDAKDLDAIEDLARRAIALQPVNARALRILGQVAALRSDSKHTADFMQAAAGLSVRESTALAWLMQSRYEAKDYEGALHWAATLLQSRPQLSEVVAPVFAGLAENEKGQVLLEAALAANPPWRQDFFSLLPSRVSDARTPLRLLQPLKDTPHPPTTSELRVYIEFLNAHKFYDVAYYTWLQFLPEEQLRRAGFVFNGDFSVKPDGLPFDWIIGSGTGVTVEISDLPDTDIRHALSVAFGVGRVEFPSVSELVLLAPGRYAIKGKYRGAIVGRRGFRWNALCAEGGAPIGQSAMIEGTAQAWTDFEFLVAVPESGCKAQSLQLVLDARSASEQFVSGAMAFSDLSARRAPAQPADAAPAADATGNGG